MPKSRNSFLPSLTEDQIQMTVVDYLRITLTTPWFHVPNGGNWPVVWKVKLKRLGHRAGVADLVFILPEGKVGFIEMKTEKGRQSESQKAFQQDVERMGCPYAVCRSLEAVQEVLEDWGLSGPK